MAQALLAEQEFELLDLMASGSKVVVEAEWRGRVARDGTWSGWVRPRPNKRMQLADASGAKEGRIVSMVSVAAADERSVRPTHLDSTTLEERSGTAEPSCSPERTHSFRSCLCPHATLPLPSAKSKYGK